MSGADQLCIKTNIIYQMQYSESKNFNLILSEVEQLLFSSSRSDEYTDNRFMFSHAP